MAENTYGGKREGAGRKPMAGEKKIPINVRVSKETKEHLLRLHEESGFSQSKIVEYAIFNINKLPKNLD